MKLVYKQPQKTANISSARGTAGKELWKLMLAAAIVLVAFYFAIGFAVNWAVPLISFETEARLFRHFDLPDKKTDDQDYQSYVTRAAAILAKVKSHPDVPPLPYRLVLIDSDKPNAFAFPGGNLAVTKGLMDVLPEDIGVAFVLGHELGHYRHRDHLQGIGRAMGMRIIMALIFGGGSGAESFGGTVEFIFQRNFSQERERMADQFGLELVHALYGEVDGVHRLFQILLEEQDLPQWAYMFATHPSPDQRIANLKAHADTLVQSGQ